MVCTAAHVGWTSGARAGRSRALLVGLGLIVVSSHLANAAKKSGGGKSIKTPSAAFEAGEPALLTADTAKDWLDWADDMNHDDINHDEAMT